jgi:CheY-like chemotaxis protein
MLRQLGYEVVSALGFAEAWEACEAPDANFDLVLLGHTIPTKDKEQMIAHLRQHGAGLILAVLRPHEGALQSADRSVVSDADDLVAAVRGMLGEATGECQS